MHNWPDVRNEALLWTSQVLVSSFMYLFCFQLRVLD